MSERQSLREYQQALFDRLRSHAANDSAQASRLGVEAGGVRWLLRLDEAQEVVTVAPLTPVPLTRPWYRGLANIRGNLFSVVDLGLFAGGPAVAPGTDARLVLLAERFHVNAALLVSRLLGLRSMSELQVAETDPGLPGWSQRWYRDASGERWRELSVADLARRQEFLQAGL